MLDSPHFRPVHLVGTVPLGDSTEVFTKVAAPLAPFLNRMPDGETGVRGYWITSQARVLHYHPMFEPADHNWTPESGAPPATGAPKYWLKRGIDPSTVELPSFGYGDFARASYRDFKAAKAQGLIAPRTRFQVCLPTPIAFYVGIVAPESREAIAPAMERRVAQELEDVLSAVPAADLAIQWDVCLEIFIWEGIRDIFFPDQKQGCIDRLIALGNLVPEPAELGYHFCYGDFKHAHAVEPKDARVMVDMANAIAAELSGRCRSCTCRCRAIGTTPPTSSRLPTSRPARKPSSISASFITQTARMARAAAWLPPMASLADATASRPSAAGAAATRPPFRNWSRSTPSARHNRLHTIDTA